MLTAAVLDPTHRPTGDVYGRGLSARSGDLAERNHCLFHEVRLESLTYFF
jgi:hypothetical protein